MAKLSKRMRKLREQVDFNKPYPVHDGLALARSLASAKFAESIDVSINLGVDPRKSDQVVRGSTVLPRGLGKAVRVAVFAQGAKAEAALQAGADIVGFEDLAERIKGGDLAFDVVIATPEAMRIVGQLGPILGPRGLMPNPKVGTVTADAEQAVRNAKAGQVRYRTDKAGIIHCPIGKASFEVDALEENLRALMSDLIKAKPATAKGVYLQTIHVSPTMGPAVTLEQGAF